MAHAAVVGRKRLPCALWPSRRPLPPEYRYALMDDACADGGRPGPGPSGRLLGLSRFPSY